MELSKFVEHVTKQMCESGMTTEEIQEHINIAAERATACRPDGNSKTEREQTIIQKTQTYLENYREMERYIKEAVSEAWQVPDINKYNISAENAFLYSIRECRAETVILFEHINRALDSLREDTKKTGEEYKFQVLEDFYVKGKTYEEIARDTGCGRNSPKKWCRSMTARLAIKLFGAKAIEK